MANESPYARQSPYAAHAMNTEFISSGRDLSAMEKMIAWPLAAINAGAASLWNSAIKLGHIGLTESEEVAFDSQYEASGKQLTQAMYGNAWAQFYEQNRGSVELGGELASLLVPGTIALKGMKLARAGNPGKWYELLDATRTRDRYLKAMQEAERNFGEYTLMFQEGRKAIAAGVALSAQEAAAVSLTSAVMLNDSRLYEDYSTRAFLTETAFGGVLGASFRVFGTLRQRKQAIAEYEKLWGATNDFADPLTIFTPQENITNMVTHRAGRAFSDPAQEKAFEIALGEQVAKLGADEATGKELTQLMVPTLKAWLRTNPKTASERTSNTLSGLRNVEKIAPRTELSTAPTLLPDGGRIYPAYLDRFTGDILDSAEPGAFEAGYALAQQGTRLITPEGKSRAVVDLTTEFIKSKGLAIRAQEADALHQVWTRAAGSKELQNALLPFKAGELRIDPDNIFHLEMAIETGRSWKTVGDVALDTQQMRERLRALKEDLLLDWNQRGDAQLTEQRMSLLLNSKLDPDTVGFEPNLLAGQVKLGELVPRLLKFNYAVPPESKEIAQATLLENIAADAWRGKFEPLVRQFGVNPISLRTSQLTSADGQTGTINFGARGEYGSAQNAFEFMGTQVRNAIGGLTAKWKSKLQVAAAPFTRDAADLGQFSMFAREIQRRPAGLQLVDLPNGNMAFFDKATRARATVLDDAGMPTSQPLPEITGAGTKAMFRELRDGVGAEFRKAHNMRVKAKGSGTKLADDVIYVPPTTGRYFALVQMPNGARSMVRGATPEDFQSRLKIAREQYPEATILEKREADLAIQRDGLYGDDFEFFENLEFNMEMVRKGYAADTMLGNDMRLVDSVVDFYTRGASALVRNSVRDYYQSDIALLRQRQDRFSQALRSRFGAQESRAEKFLDRNTPFSDRIATMLDLSSSRRLPIFDSLNETVNELGARAYEIVRNLRPNLSEAQIQETGQKLNVLARQMGINQDFTNLQQQIGLTQKYNPTFASGLVARTNAVLATAQLGVDIANTMVNLVSFAVGAVPEILALQKKIVSGQLADHVGSVRIPGTSQSIFTPYRALAQVVKELAPGGNRDRLKAYVERGILQPRTLEYFDLHDQYFRALGEGAKTGAWQAAKDAGTKAIVGAREWLLEKPNAMLRYASVRSVELLLENSGLPAQMVDLISSQFVKRVQHNFPFGQRPILFQGPVGQAITLYQTYMFNTLQNMVRYVGEGDARAITAFMGMQIGTFGLQSNPIFKGVNQAIAYRDGNPDRKDLYSEFQDADWLLYGPVSAGLNMNLYTRGDLTPRTPILLPTSPAEIPALGQTARVFGSLFDGVKRIASATTQGEVDAARVGQIVSQTVQESGFSRPLSGMAAILGGDVVDTRGNLVQDGIGFADAMRLTGARPFEEGKLLDIQRRFIAKKLEDRELVMKHGKQIREKIRAGQEFTGQDLANAIEGYVNAGGNEDNFLNWLKLETEKATVPLAKRLADKYKNDRDMAPWLDYLNERARGLD